MIDGQSPSSSSRSDRREARDEKRLRKRDRAVNEIIDLGPPTRRSLIVYRGTSWLVFTVVAALVGALVTWAATKAIGPAVAGGLGAAILIWTVMFIKKVIYYNYVYTPIPSKAEESKTRARWKDRQDEKDRFLRAAVANKRNPAGRRPEEYPAYCRELVGSMADVAGEISAGIRVVDCSRDSITIDTGHYFIDSIKKELADLAAKDNKRLTVQWWSWTEVAKITETLNGLAAALRPQRAAAATVPSRAETHVVDHAAYIRPPLARCCQRGPDCSRQRETDTESRPT